MTKRIAWFVAVGCAAAAVHLGTVMLLVSQLHWPPLVANVAGWMVAFCVSFSGHWHLTFPRSGAPLVRAARRFLMVSATGFAINEAMYAVLLHFTGTAWYAVVLFFVLLAVAVMTYLLSSRWAFRGTGPA
ncbi:MAG TPA: GtrA family protein [Ramlibacter sp.]|jgi:putative flippase GtrA